MDADRQPLSAAELHQALQKASSRLVVQSLRLGNFLLVGLLPEQNASGGWVFRTAQTNPVLPPLANGQGVFPQTLIWPVRKFRPPSGGTSGPDVLVGRATNNDVVISHTSVSKLHARIALSRISAVLSDADSSNGTAVGGQVLPPGQQRALENGDEVLFGKVALTFLHTAAFLAVLQAKESL